MQGGVGAHGRGRRAPLIIIGIIIVSTLSCTSSCCSPEASAGRSSGCAAGAARASRHAAIGIPAGCSTIVLLLASATRSSVTPRVDDRAAACRVGVGGRACA
jgi:hypothetical protein